MEYKVKASLQLKSCSFAVSSLRLKLTQIELSLTDVSYKTFLVFASFTQARHENRKIRHEQTSEEKNETVLWMKRNPDSVSGSGLPDDSHSPDSADFYEGATPRNVLFTFPRRGTQCDSDCESIASLLSPQRCRTLQNSEF